MQSLQERLDSIRRDLDMALREVEKIRAQEALILDMQREARGEPKTKIRAPRSNVKQTILDLLADAGDAGLNAALAVETAAKAKVTLERGTVSSLLSRLKNEGVVSYDGSLYRLVKPKQDTSPNVHPLRTSGVFS
ncbi:MAG: hypothetical protein KF887_05380 [Paracoccaceae bacterium]|nr:MAG: hypothetical protein KF887_05380 [Paracoccaceae bacterium]